MIKYDKILEIKNFLIKKNAHNSFKFKVRFAGYNHDYDVILFHEDKKNENEYKFAAFYLLSDIVVAVCSVDWDPVCALFAEAMQNGIHVKRHHIEADPLDIKKLLV